MTTEAERLYLLNQLTAVATKDLGALWQQLSRLSNPEFIAWLTDAFPELVEQYAVAAAELGAEWYAESAPDEPYQPQSFLPEPDGLPTSVTWALGATGEAALTRLEGVAQRHIWTANRETIIGNAEAEPGSQWVRVARSGACAFCAMVATRGAVYSSREAATQVVGRGVDMSINDRRIRAAGGNRRLSGQFAAGGRRTRGSRELGKAYHDHCHCQAKEVRPGQSYQPPAYVQQWEEAYRDASRKASKDAVEAQERGEDVTNTGTSAVLANMRAALGTH